jgi:hypothetical protein
VLATSVTSVGGLAMPVLAAVVHAAGSITLLVIGDV